MTRRCLHCSHNGYNSHTCPQSRGEAVWGMIDQWIRQEEHPHGNLSHYASSSSCGGGGASLVEGGDHGNDAAEGYASEDFAQGSGSSSHEQKRCILDSASHKGSLQVGTGGWRGEEATQVQARDGGAKGDQEVLEEHRTPHPQATLSESFKKNLAGHWNRKNPRGISVESSVKSEAIIPLNNVLITGSTKDHIFCCSPASRIGGSKLKSGIRIAVRGTTCDVREGKDVKSLVAFARDILGYIDIWANHIL